MTCNLAAGERRLEDIGRVHRALGRARTHDGVHFIDKQDDVAGLFDLVDGRF